MEQKQTPNRCNETQQRAWVAFTNQTDMVWLKILKPGFRHCFVILQDEHQWLSLDPLSNYIDITVHDHLPVDFNLPLWLRSRGHTVVPATIDRTSSKSAPWMFVTCVETVKRVLGIRRRFIFTPWQLYRHLGAYTEKISNKGVMQWEV